MHDGAKGSTSGDAAELPDLALTGESLLPSLPSGLGAIRPPKVARRPCRQLRRRPRHLLPTWEWIGGIGDNAAADDQTRADGERGQDSTDAAARGELRLPGYGIGRFYGKDGTPYVGTRPSRKSVRRLLQRVHDATTPHKHAEDPELRVATINRPLRGWAEYFNQGPVLPTYKLVRWYVQRRLQRC